MLITKSVKVKIINFNVDYYKEKGYDCKIGDIIDVDVWDVSIHSKQRITLLCDDCKKEHKEISIESLNKSKPYENGRYLCPDCSHKYLNNRKCDICGSTHEVSDYLNKGVLLCEKHQKQIRKFGSVKRTTKDINEIRILDNYAEFDTYDIKGNINGTFKIDLDLVNFVKTHKMHKHKDGYACYKFKNKDGVTKNMRLHRYVMGVSDNFNSELIDHINRDKSDNRRNNLRLVTQETNNRNVGMYGHNTSGYKGISFDKRANKWEVYIHQNNKKVGLGRYGDLNKAIQVREIAEIIYFGADSPRYEELIKKYINNKQIQEYLLNNKQCKEE